MKTVHHIESPDELLHLLNPHRGENDRFPFSARSKIELKLSLSNWELKLGGEDSEKYKLELSTQDVCDLIVSVFDKCGIDLDFVK